MYIHRVVASEKGKNHTIIVCGSASGHVVPPMVIFPRVRVPQHFKEKAPPGSWLRKKVGSMPSSI